MKVYLQYIYSIFTMGLEIDDDCFESLTNQMVSGKELIGIRETRLTVMLVTPLCFTTDTNISKLSPIHFVSNTRHQYRYNQHAIELEN